MIKAGDKAYGLAAVSDVEIGFGSPQILELTRSLSSSLGVEALLLQPDQYASRAAKRFHPPFDVKRIYLKTHPHSQSGRTEYILECARLLNRLRPEYLVFFCTFTLPVLLKLKYKPKLVIYDSLESILAYGDMDIRVNRCLAEKIDLVIFPEENRCVLDGARCGLLERPFTVVYNVPDSRKGFTPLPAGKRRKAVLYSGTIDYYRTLGRYFLFRKAQRFPIDLYGPVEGNGKERFLAALESLGGRVRYQGMVESEELKKIRPEYSFSLVMWSPDNENQLYACPNKFFEAVLDGVPPITAPHPQTKMLVERYGCGIVMEDWSFPSFLAALEEARAVMGTREHARMIRGCMEAVEYELNWDAQFRKVRDKLLSLNVGVQ